MACERWWVSCCYVNILVIAVGFSSVAADRGIYYGYDDAVPYGSSDNVAEVPDLRLLDGESVRYKRSPLETSKPQNVSTPTTEAPLTTQKANNGFANVAYSTDNSTRNNATSQPTLATVPQGKAEVIVSQPLNPATGKIDIHPRVWANATMAPPIVTQHVDNKTGNVSTSNTTAVNATVASEDPIRDDISINKFGDLTNSTLSENNITKTQEDTHQYYNSTTFVSEVEGRKLWVDMVNHPNVSVNDLLSKSHRRAATVKLSFDFPFYGHIVRNVTIATGGFLYTGEYVHSWLAATQYIAPLMANFDTTLSKDSYVKYADNGTAFTVEWENVVLQEKPNVGAFSFQTTLHKNGDIVFVYASVPLVVEKIQDNLHPVKVGLSDAYIIDRTVFLVRRKTIYEYHRVNFIKQDIKNWTVIYLRALPTCLGMRNCDECISKSTGFECKWCPSLKKCGTGTDRHRQEWIVKNCESTNIKEGDTCPAEIINTTIYNEHEHDIHNVEDDDGAARPDLLSVSGSNSQQQAKALRPSAAAADSMNMGVSGILGILLIVSLVMGLVGWAVYAYRNPHSASGQVLIRYRPSQWSWRRGEARYTAATIHM